MTYVNDEESKWISESGTPGLKIWPPALLDGVHALTAGVCMAVIMARVMFGIQQGRQPLCKAIYLIFQIEYTIGCIISRA